MLGPMEQVAPAYPVLPTVTALKVGYLCVPALKGTTELLGKLQKWNVPVSLIMGVELVVHTYDVLYGVSWCYESHTHTHAYTHTHMHTHTHTHTHTNTLTHTHMQSLPLPPATCEYSK